MRNITKPIYRQINFSESKRSKWSLPNNDGRNSEIDFDQKSFKSLQNLGNVNQSAVFYRRNKNHKPKFKKFLDDIQYQPKNNTISKM